MRNKTVTGSSVTAPTSTASGFAADNYEYVAASATTQALGATGASGDYLARLIVFPGTTAPGAVTLFDDVATVFVYAGGSAPTVEPFEIILGIFSVSGAFKITTGANVSVLAIGSFT